MNQFVTNASTAGNSVIVRTTATGVPAPVTIGTGIAFDGTTLSGTGTNLPSIYVNGANVAGANLTNTATVIVSSTSSNITMVATNITAIAGDSATAFFSAGQIERARGGLGADTSAYGTGLIGSDGANATIDVDSLAELDTAIGITGTPDATTFWRGDNSWAVPSVGSQTPWASDINGAGFSLTNASGITLASTNAGQIDFNEASANGTSVVALKAPDSLASSVTNTLPATTGTLLNENSTINAATVTVVDSTDATSFIAIFDSATGNLAPKTDESFKFDASGKSLNLDGPVGSSARIHFLENGVQRGLLMTGINGTAGDFGFGRYNGSGVFQDIPFLIATATGNATFTAGVTAASFSGPIAVVDSTDATSFVGIYDSATGNLLPKTDAAMTYNASNGTLDVATVTEAGANVPNSGDDLSFFSATTSIQMRGVMSDEVGAGPMMFTRVGVVRSMALPMGAWFTNGISGSLAIQTNLTGGSGDTWSFADAVTNTIRILFPLPVTWDAGTVKFSFDMGSTGNNTSSTNVVYSLRAASFISNAGDVATPTWGTAITFTNHISAVSNRLVTCITGPLTIGNTPAINQQVLFELTRATANAVDVNTNNIQIAGAQLFYTETVTEPAMPATTQ